MYLISLKAGHPTGRFQRAGIVVERLAPVLVDEVPAAIKAEKWLETRSVNPIELKALLKRGVKDLREKREMTQPVHEPEKPVKKTTKKATK